MTEQKQIMLDGDTLEAARTFVKTLDQHKLEMQELYDEFGKRRAFLAEAQVAVARENWNVIVEPHGINSEETWVQGTWRLDTTFLETYGFAFLCEHEQLPEPMQNKIPDTPAPKTMH